MRAARLLLVIAAAITLSGCVDSLRSQVPSGDRSGKFALGFWYWQGYRDAAVPASIQPDVLFFHAGTIDKTEGRKAGTQWSVYGDIPDALPSAREYWLTFRYEHQSVPDAAAVPVVAREVSQLLALSRQRHLNVRGVQFDIDSPTKSLGQYAVFIRDVRKRLPSGTEISITALLDWFRDGTSIADVVKEVDEFVPQFYDVQNPLGNGGHAIAETFDAVRWAPKFNAFGKRYRVGLATFGRARAEVGGSMQPIYSDLKMLDLAMNPAFQVETTRNDADELVITYRAKRNVNIAYNQFHAGDAVQFVLSTPSEVKGGVENARRMGGFCAGVVFFRWPGPGETLTMQSDDVMRAAGLRGVKAAEGPVIQLVDGHCAAVKCADVYLMNATPRTPKPVRYRAQSSGALEYFLPTKPMPARMVDATHLEVVVPAYCGEGRMLLGRVVSKSPVTFTVEYQ